ncbi:MAG: Holliday junction branch migration protein RuvA [Gaiellales bacterium]|nr:MAG: Holliday junction branch migration protein RuvA [Gaiellales bacterium]
MIASLKGFISHQDADGVIIDVGGVGYRLAMSARGLAALDGSAGEVFVFTHMHVREDVMSLYGFADAGERDFFEVLKGVSGIGPKVALAILSAYSPDDLSRAVLNKDLALFTSISGIGRKTAERLVLELKDRIGELPAEAERPGGGEGGYYLAREALISLGYNFTEAEAALGGLDMDGDVEMLVREALKRIGAPA